MTLAFQNYPNFPYTWTNTNEETSWKSLVLVNRSSTCNVDMTDFGLTVVSQVTVEQSDGQEVDAYAVENDFDGTDLYSGTSLMVECECVKEVVEEKCISPIDNEESTAVPS
ncbi:expressed unknown protein [Seminavis robusta]|uniref:Uncharacterized protein n=1 Tax=Seminavis robusta TaxID=568900 RepID=A0A9N8DJA6_9STRA|nr:expressed unknown protein [Seminavis robusta]|eukprot:Sro115_g056690.1 n/a (111) ;mRNA; f:34572-34904